MASEPTGHIESTAEGRLLVFERDLPLSADQAWAWITESEKLGRWFGTWTGRGEAGGGIEVTMTAEDGNPRSTGRITKCDPQSSYAVELTDDSGGWRLELELQPEGHDHATLRFVQHLDPSVEVEKVGPGWEYYLDRLVAAITGTGMPDFSDYWPSMGPHFADQE